MSANQWFAVHCVFGILAVVLSGNFQCDRNNTSLVKKELPAGLALPVQYSVVVRFTDWSTNITSLIRERRILSQNFVTKVTRKSTANFVFGERNFTFNETACDAIDDLKSLPVAYPVGSSDFANALKFSGFSLGELINETVAYKFSNYSLENTTAIVGGIDAVVWLGCDQTSSNTSIVQVEVAYAAENSLTSYSSTIKNPYVLSIEIAVFSKSDKKLLSNVSMYVSELEALPIESAQPVNPPAGIYCNGFPAADIPSTLPDKFGISFDHTNVHGKTVHNIDMLYDGQERIISMHLNTAQDRDLPFFGNASIPKDLADDHLIHDFKYGFQYLLDSENNVCSTVTAIDADFGDVIMIDAATKEIDLKTPAHLFLSTPNATFYHAGVRMVNDIPLDVYVTRNILSNNALTVIEMLYTKEDWVVETAVAPFLHSIIQYHLDDATKKTQKTIIRVHSFINSTTTGTQWSLLSAYPCLNLVEDSYLYVTIKNGTLKDLEMLGINRVRNAIREAVAHVAQVSILRVANFFFKQVQQNVVAFFVIGDATDIAPANTRDRSNESSVTEAVTLLNTTLQNKDISFVVYGIAKKTELMLSKLSLGIIPTKWGPLPAPAPHFTGYSGGSMFVLAFFMLLLGAAGGFGALYLIWKRQHVSGLAYQVFE